MIEYMFLGLESVILMSKTDLSPTDCYIRNGSEIKIDTGFENLDFTQNRLIFVVTSRFIRIA